MLAEAEGGAQVWSGSTEGIGDDDVGIRPTEVTADEVRFEGVTAEEWAATVEMGPGYEIGWAGDAAIDGELDVSLPLPGGASVDDVVFVWFSSGGVEEYAPALYDPETGMVTASVPARLLKGEGPSTAEVSAPAAAGVELLHAVAAPGGGMVVKAFWGDVLDKIKAAPGKIAEIAKGTVMIVAGGARLIWNGVAWVAERGAEIIIGGGARYVWNGVTWVSKETGKALGRGAELVIDGVRHVWNGVRFVVKALNDLLAAGWVALVDHIRHRLNSFTGRTDPQCSGDQLANEGEPALGAPDWAEVSKQQLSMVHVCKFPAGSDRVMISLKSNRGWAALVQVPEDAGDLDVELQPDEWIRQTMADMASLWPWAESGAGFRPILLLGGTQLDYTLERPDRERRLGRVPQAVYSTLSLDIFNGFSAAFPVLEEPVIEFATMYTLGKECWDDLNQQDSILVGALAECWLDTHETYFSRSIWDITAFEDAKEAADRFKDKYLEETGRKLDDRAADTIQKNQARTTKSVRKLRSIKNAATKAGGWIAALGGLIPWVWDTLHDADDLRMLEYALQPKNNTGTSSGTENDNEDDTGTGNNQTEHTATGTIASGRFFSCAIRTDQTITCWGNNDYGQTDAPAGQYAAIAASNWHLCAIRTDQTITCWGWNDSGQTDAPTGQYNTIAVGGGHSCAIRTDQTITCWGWNRSGQADAPAGQYSTIAVGDEHSCAIRTDQTITCWGNNDYSQTDAPAGQYNTIDASSNHSCAVRTDRAIACWGSYDYSFTHQSNFDPADAPAGQYSTIEASPVHACAIRTDQTIACWGRDDFDDLIDPPQAQYSTIDPGSNHSCAVKTDQTIACWGNNDYGQTDAPAGQYTAIDTDYNHSCAIRTDQTIVCWGDIATTPTGRYSALAASCAIRIDKTITCWRGNDGQDPPAGQYTAIDTGFGHSCALRTDQTIACWGWNRSGQTDAPVGQYTSIDIHDEQSCAIRIDQTIICWGSDGYGHTNAPAGQYTDLATIGYGHFCALQTDRTISCVDYWGDIIDPPEGQYTAIASGGYEYFCAIRTDKAVVCWGSNAYDDIVDSPEGQFTDLSTHFGHSCAIRIDKTITCWGANSYYGNDYGQTDAPAGQYTAIDTDYYHSCALRTDQVLVCWGLDDQPVIEG